KQVSPDGSLSKDVDTIVLQSGQSEMADGCWGVYDLDRGFKLVGSLSASGTVLVTVTYELI
ncbi:hypothetical protein, partial [Thermococcus sp.]|uniref:hypothetical protein n=1 Tax=Thermococcus sp. TaxID=35749 RepID=UPI0026148E45